MTPPDLLQWKPRSILTSLEMATRTSISMVLSTKCVKFQFRVKCPFDIIALNVSPFIEKTVCPFFFFFPYSFVLLDSSEH